jgi:hypothetical protein
LHWLSKEFIAGRPCSAQLANTHMSIHS